MVAGRLEHVGVERRMPGEWEHRTRLELGGPHGEAGEKVAVVAGDHSRDAAFGEPALGRLEHLDGALAGLVRGREVPDEADGLLVELLVAPIDQGRAAHHLPTVGVGSDEERVLDVGVQRRATGKELDDVCLGRRDGERTFRVHAPLQARERPHCCLVAGRDLPDRGFMLDCVSVHMSSSSMGWNGATGLRERAEFAQHRHGSLGQPDAGGSALEPRRRLEECAIGIRDRYDVVGAVGDISERTGHRQAISRAWNYKLQSRRTCVGVVPVSKTGVLSSFLKCRT